MKKIYFNTLQIENSYEDNSGLLIEGYAAHFKTPNLKGEIVDQNSFTEFFEMYNDGRISPVMNYHHDPQQIIGKVDELTCDETGLYMKSHINRGVKICDDMIIPNILNGTITGLSTEGLIKNGIHDIVEYEDGSYYLKNMILTAIAITGTPCDIDARFSVANCIEEYRTFKAKELEKQVRWYLL